MSVTVSYDSKVSVQEALDSTDAPGADSASARTLKHEAFNTTHQGLTSSTSVPCTDCAYFDVTIAGGVGAIDLTALDAVVSTKDLTGKKVQIIKLKAQSGNSGVTAVTKGAANGYGLDSGGASWTVNLGPGQEALLFLNELAPDVAAGAKAIDLSGTNGDVVECAVIGG